MLQIPELLAPAGDLERLRYAINYGADAVYCSLPECGMRAAPANFTPEQLTEGVWYQDAKGRYYSYPDEWTDSFYGVRDALSNLLTYGSNGNQVTAKDREAATASYAALQQEIMADYADMKAAVAAADTLEAKQAAATNASNAMSQKVYNTTLKMYNKLQAKTAARAWVSSLLHCGFAAPEAFPIKPQRPRFP